MKIANNRTGKKKSSSVKTEEIAISLLQFNNVFQPQNLNNVCEVSMKFALSLRRNAVQTKVNLTRQF